MNTTATREPFVLEVCSDCLQWLANGEVENPDESFNADYLDGREITLGAVRGVCDGCDDDGQCESWFSWRRCDGCGSALGGDRHHATEWLD